MNDPVLAVLFAAIAGLFIGLALFGAGLLGYEVYLFIYDKVKERKAKKAEFVRRLKDERPDWYTVNNIIGVKIESIIVDGKDVTSFEIQRQMERKIKNAMLASLK